MLYLSNLLLKNKDNNYWNTADSSFIKHFVVVRTTKNVYLTVIMIELMC